MYDWPLIFMPAGQTGWYQYTSSTGLTTATYLPQGLDTFDSGKTIRAWADGGGGRYSWGSPDHTIVNDVYNVPKIYLAGETTTTTTTPVPTPVPTPAPVVNLKRGLGWSINKGDCSINISSGLPCVVNKNYPFNYTAEEFCNISVSGPLSFAQFTTEKWFDYVKIADVEYSGNMAGTVESTAELIWSSDFYIEGPGWMICKKKAEDPIVR